MGAAMFLVHSKKEFRPGSSKPLLVGVLCLLWIPLQASNVTICNCGSKPYKVAARSERSWLLGGGYKTVAWWDVPAKSCGGWTWRHCANFYVPNGYTSWFSFIDEKNNSVILSPSSSGGSGGDISMCLKVDAITEYVSDKKSDASCSTGYKLHESSFGIYGGDNDLKLDVN